MLLKSETIHNLVNAFAGESQARNRYMFYAKEARKEGYLRIADVFEITAKNEFEHAKLFYKYIPNNNYEIKASYPYFTGKTYDNLKAAADAEYQEWTRIYRASADTAKKEGFLDIAKSFSLIVEIEKSHECRFLELAELVKTNSIYSKDNEVRWMCTKCGYQTVSKSSPLECPACHHDYSYFIINCEKY